ncbi:hypothetical protein HK101_010426 [Irineochytrium annulatum]|nr:hypothetical protein HK101_010426 [Irineochytrium annulatum]
MKFPAALLVAASLVVAVTADRPPWEPPKKNYVRSACPMLNALANHDLLDRKGENIAMGEVIEVMERDLAMPSSTAFIQSMYMGIFADKYDYNVKLSSFSAFEHDASLSRQDISMTGHRKVDKALVEQLISFSGTKGYLTYDDLARARRLRYVQSKASNPKFKFTIFQRAWAIWEGVLLMEVLGEKGKLKVDIARDFFINERLPLKWNAHLWDTGFWGYKMGYSFVSFALKTYFVPDLPAVAEPAKAVAEDHEEL